MSFEMADYDVHRPLYIDPLIYSTYLGGNGEDRGTGIAVDSAGNAYVTGSAGSTDFPTMNPLQAANGGVSDGVVSKIRISRKGIRSGGQSFSRGELYELLSNPIYIGEIRHKQERHPGQHEAILDRNL